MKIISRVTLCLLNTATWLIHKTPAILSTNQIPNFKQCAFFTLRSNHNSPNWLLWLLWFWFYWPELGCHALLSSHPKSTEPSRRSTRLRMKPFWSTLDLFSLDFRKVDFRFTLSFARSFHPPLSTLSSLRTFVSPSLISYLQTTTDTQLLPSFFQLQNFSFFSFTWSWSFAKCTSVEGCS